MAATILGIGTSQPEHSMTQEEALEMSTRILGQDDRRTRLLRVMFRKAAVNNRQTVVPHRVAYDWIGSTDLDKEPAHAQAAGSAFSALGGTGAAPMQSKTEVADAAVKPPSSNGDEPEFGGPTTGERMQMYGEFAAPLALESSVAALEDAGVDPRRVTHLVTVSCTGFDAPGVDIELISKLGLPLDTQRLQVGFMGCHGAINGMRAAQAIVESQPGAIVLLCAVELCSLHFRFNWDDDGMIGNALFADGSAALVVADRGEQKSSMPHELCSASIPWNIDKTGSCVIPDSRHVMSWSIRDFGFEMRLTGEVGPKIEAHLRPWLEQWLAQSGESIESIGEWAVHPGGPKILSAVESSLTLPETATGVSREVLSSCGNMSSPTILFILNQIRRKSEARSMVALGFGPGLVAEAVLLRR